MSAPITNNGSDTTSTTATVPAASASPPAPTAAADASALPGVSQNQVDDPAQVAINVTVTDPAPATTTVAAAAPAPALVTAPACEPVLASVAVDPIPTAVMPTTTAAEATTVVQSATDQASSAVGTATDSEAVAVPVTQQIPTDRKYKIEDGNGDATGGDDAPVAVAPSTTPPTTQPAPDASTTAAGTMAPDSSLHRVEQSVGGILLGDSKTVHDSVSTLDATLEEWKVKMMQRPGVKDAGFQIKILDPAVGQWKTVEEWKQQLAAARQGSGGADGAGAADQKQAGSTSSTNPSVAAAPVPGLQPLYNLLTSPLARAMGIKNVTPIVKSNQPAPDTAAGAATVPVSSVSSPPFTSASAPATLADAPTAAAPTTSPAVIHANAPKGLKFADLYDIGRWMAMQQQQQQANAATRHQQGAAAPTTSTTGTTTTGPGASLPAVPNTNSTPSASSASVPAWMRFLSGYGRVPATAAGQSVVLDGTLRARPLAELLRGQDVKVEVKRERETKGDTKADSAPAPAPEATRVPSSAAVDEAVPMDTSEDTDDDMPELVSDDEDDIDVGPSFANFFRAQSLASIQARLRAAEAAAEATAKKAEKQRAKKALDKIKRMVELAELSGRAAASLKQVWDVGLSDDSANTLQASIEQHVSIGHLSIAAIGKEMLRLA